MPEEVKNPSSKQPWYISMVMQVITLPGGVAVLIVLVFLGMLTGYIPTAFTDDIVTIKTNVDNLRAGQFEIKQQIINSTEDNNKQDEILIKLLRGICILQAKNSADQLQYCNP